MSRTYKINEKQMTFSCQKFKEVFRAYRKSKKKSVSDQIDDLAKGLKVNYSTVENWYKGKNGPQDMEMIKDLAAALEVDDYMILMEEIDGGEKMYKLTDRQKDASKRIYDVLIWFLEEFRNSDGLSCFCEDEAFERLTQMQERVQLILSQECFDLHDVLRMSAVRLSALLYHIIRAFE